MLVEFDQVEPANRYSAERTLHEVTFSCVAPSASQVSVAGDFNHWNPFADPMLRMPDGCWVLSLPLHHGHHQYYFLIDGQPTLDPRSLGTVRNKGGDVVSLIAVS
ncbi:MAG: glycoside hydrolase family 13 [Verrucomicrobiota bacterium]|jgi:1,4-alpha-glucan branching enzyme